jgi:small subunit ribosomal protein S11
MDAHETTQDRPRRRVKLTSKGKVRKRRRIRWGVFYITMGKANTVVSLTDTSGDLLFWESAGSCGYKGRKKGTALAGRVVALKVARRAYRMGIREGKIVVHGWGKGRRSAVRAIGTFLPPRTPKKRPTGGRSPRRWRESPVVTLGQLAQKQQTSKGSEQQGNVYRKWRGRSKPYRRSWRSPRAFRIRVLICTSSPPHNGCRPPRKRHIRRRKPRRLVDLYSYLLVDYRLAADKAKGRPSK